LQCKNFGRLSVCLALPKKCSNLFAQGLLVLLEVVVFFKHPLVLIGLDCPGTFRKILEGAGLCPSGHSCLMAGRYLPTINFGRAKVDGGVICQRNKNTCL